MNQRNDELKKKIELSKDRNDVDEVVGPSQVGPSPNPKILTRRERKQMAAFNLENLKRITELLTVVKLKYSEYAVVQMNEAYRLWRNFLAALRHKDEDKIVWATFPESEAFLKHIIANLHLNDFTARAFSTALKAKLKAARE